MEEGMTFIVTEVESGKRLDLYLAFKLPKYSRSQLKSLIVEEKVSINGEIQFHP
ncbi:MAG: S4 domain-containing protein, partial [Candidatus Dojkabacteria bacterium]